MRGSLVVAAVLFASPLAAQEESTGPTVKGHGPVYAIPDAVEVG